MKARIVTALGLIALSTGCTSTGSTSGGGAAVMAGVEVTRFHLDRNIARGEIAIEPLDPAQGGSLEFARHAAAVERQLTALGWAVTRSNRRSEQVALVRLEQGSREALRRRSGLSIGLGGGSYGRGGGIGGGVSVPIGGGSAGQVIITELAVRLQRRSDGTTMWEGRAQAEALAGTPAAQPTMMVDRLAQALFQGFPGESGRTVRVR